MSELTPRQSQILEFIRERIQESGMPPTRAEIAAELGFRSANAAEEHLRLHPDVPETTDTLFVVNRHDSYQGILRLSTLLTNDPELFVANAHFHTNTSPRTSAPSAPGPTAGWPGSSAPRTRR